MRRATLITLALALGSGASCEDADSGPIAAPEAALDLPAAAQTDVPTPLDASRSRHPRGLPLSYVFSVADGTPPIETATPVSYHVFRTPGRYEVCVEVIAAPAATARRCASLTVLPFENVGLDPSAPPDAGADRGPPDAGPDLAADGPPADGPPDLAPPDLAPPDLAPPDLAPPDLAPPDLAPPDLAPPDAGVCFAEELGGTGTAGYAMKEVAACHAEIFPSATPLGITADDQGVLTFLPFDFWYYGKSQFAVGVSSNGYLQFPAGGILELAIKQPAPLPTPVAPNNLVAAFWDDLAPATGATDVYTASLGTAPRRIFVIQWHQWTFSGSGGAGQVSFAVYLYESSNAIELQYLQLSGGDRATGGSAAVGIEDAAGAAGIQRVWKQPGGVSTAGGVRFVPK